MPETINPAKLRATEAAAELYAAEKALSQAKFRVTLVRQALGW